MIYQCQVIMSRQLFFKLNHCKQKQTTITKDASKQYFVFYSVRIPYTTFVGNSISLPFYPPDVLRSFIPLCSFDCRWHLLSMSHWTAPIIWFPPLSVQQICSQPEGSPNLEYAFHFPGDLYKVSLFIFTVDLAANQMIFPFLMFFFQ